MPRNNRLNAREKAQIEVLEFHFSFFMELWFEVARHLQIHVVPRQHVGPAETATNQLAIEFHLFESEYLTKTTYRRWATGAFRSWNDCRRSLRHHLCRKRHCGSWLNNKNTRKVNTYLIHNIFLRCFIQHNTKN